MSLYSYLVWQYQFSLMSQTMGYLCPYHYVQRPDKSLANIPSEFRSCYKSRLPRNVDETTIQVLHETYLITTRDLADYVVKIQIFISFYLLSHGFRQLSNTTNNKMI